MAPAQSPFTQGLSTESGLGNDLSSPLEQSDASWLETDSWMGSTGLGPSESALGPRRRQMDSSHFSEQHPVSAVSSTLSGRTGNHYWCTVCEDPNSYKDSGDWKKHEKGHETVFICRLDDAVKDDSTGQRSSPKGFSCKRRHQMVEHLNKSHGISAVQQGRNLADKWRVSNNKQAWSCGFCVKFFSNFQDRLRHIDVEHFKKYETIQDWDYNKVIHGLLLQPKMENAWKNRTASLLLWEFPEDIVWGESFAKNMRTQLEIGPLDELDADRLADAVYSARKPRESWNKDAMAPTTFAGNSEMGESSFSLGNHYPDVAGEVSGCGTAYLPNSATSGATTSHFEHSVFGRLPANACNDSMAIEPTLVSSDGGISGNCDATLFYSPQQW